MLFFFSWPAVGLILAAGLVMGLLSDTGMAWPLFGAGLVVLGGDLAFRLRFPLFSCLVRRDAGGHILLIPMWSAGLLLLAVSGVQLASAPFQALDADVRALKSERASGDSALANKLLTALKLGTPRGAKATWHVHAETRGESVLLLVWAPEMRKPSKSTIASLRFLLRTVEGKKQIFGGVFAGSPLKCAGAVTGAGRKSKGLSGMWRLTDFYASEQGKLAKKPGLLALMILGLLIAGLAQRYKSAGALAQSTPPTDGKGPSSGPGLFRRFRAYHPSFVGLFALLAKLAKADGHISPEEIALVQQFMDAIGLDAEQQKVAIQIFNVAKDDPMEIDLVADAFKRAESDSDRRIMVYQLLVDVAFADGTLDTAERDILEALPPRLGIPEWAFKRFVVGHAQGGSGLDLKSCYDLLGCAQDASDADLKSAYREAAKMYHPDTIAAKNLPPEFTKFAEDQFKKYTEAYDQIKRARAAQR